MFGCDMLWLPITRQHLLEVFSIVIVAIQLIFFQRSYFIFFFLHFVSSSRIHGEERMLFPRFLVDVRFSDL